MQLCAHEIGGELGGEHLWSILTAERPFLQGGDGIPSGWPLSAAQAKSLTMPSGAKFKDSGYCCPTGVRSHNPGSPDL